MFVNSCLFKVCFVWILAFVLLLLWSLQWVFLFFCVKMITLQQTHKHTQHTQALAVDFTASSIVKNLKKRKRTEKILWYHKCFQENMEFRVFTWPTSRTGVSHKLFRTDTLFFSFLSPGGFLKHIGHRKRLMIRSFFFPCWRHQHLTLHTTNCDVPTAFELPTPSAPLWNVTTKKTF